MYGLVNSAMMRVNCLQNIALLQIIYMAIVLYTPCLALNVGKSALSLYR